MAKVWPAYEGKRTTHGDAWADLPLDDAVRILDLEPKDFLGELNEPPKFGDTERDMSWTGYQHILVEIAKDEARGPWKPGFYRSLLAPREAYFRLRVHEMLRDQWRDEWKKGYDADGDPAVWLWAVLKPEAQPTEWSRQNRENIEADIRREATESGLPGWVYVRFRNGKEEGRTAS